MKHKILFFFLLTTALFALSGQALASTTVLVYLCGAAIQSEACDDLIEMAEAETGDNVSLVILAGGSGEWDMEELEGGSRTLVTLRDGYFDTLSDWGWASMGSEESLLEFLEYGLTEFPADRTALILWDHGAGSEGGICFDETTEDEDGLTLTEINNVLYDLDESLGGFHLDLFGCDACMMASYEMAAMLSCYEIDYFLASEELEPGSGWEYTSWLRELERDPDMDTPTLCKKIIDSYFDYGMKEEPDEYMTLSAIDLSRIPPLADTLEEFSARLLSTLDQGGLSELRRGRSRLYSFGSYVDASWDMVDMGAMLDAYAGYDPGLAAKAKKQLAESVLYKRQTDNLQPCKGLALLVPQDTSGEFDYYSEGFDLSAYIPNWISFVNSYARQLQSGNYSFSQSAPSQVSGSSIFLEMAQLFSGSGGYDWDEDSEEYVSGPSGEGGTEVQMGDGDYAFTASLTKEDLQYLDYVEGMLLMDVSDEEITGYVDFGLLRNNLVDWGSGKVYSLFDGTWPLFGDQMVPLYDQMSNEYGRRSLLPVKLNGEHTYLVVEFKEGETEGRVIGANAGYDENGLPIRSTDRLKEGDRIVPVYTLYVDNGGEDLEESEFEGDEIIWKEGMTVSYEDLGEGSDDSLPMLFCFVLNDVFGEYSMTEFVSFEIL